MSQQGNESAISKLENKLLSMQLYPAILINDANTLQTLLEGGADVNFVFDSGGDSMLHHAISRGNMEMVKILINNGANIFQRNYAGSTVLDYARRSKNHEVEKEITKLFQSRLEEAKHNNDQQAIEEITAILHPHDINQGLIVSKLLESVQWMQKYEQEKYEREHKSEIDTGKLPKILDPAQQTQKFDGYGLCFGLSAYLAHCVMTNEQIAHKKQDGQKLAENPYTVDSFFKKIHQITLEKIPGQEASINDKEAFHKKMNLFMHEILQLQGDTSKDRIQNFNDILNEAAPQNNASKVQKTYFFTSSTKLMEWVKQAKPGDILEIKTPKHAMLLYATADSEGKTKVGFYDPNEYVRHEVLQTLAEDRLRNIIKDLVFDPQYFSNEANVDPVVICAHIASVNSKNPTIDIASDLLNAAQQEQILRTAIYTNSVEIIGELANSYPNIINSQNRVGYKPIHMSITDSRINVMRKLLEWGADKDSLTSDGLTPLHLAVIKDQIEAVEALLNAGVKLDIRDKSGCTPLHYAVHQGNVKTIKVLLEGGADKDALTPDGLTPLHLAAAHNHVEAVKALLNAGVKLDIKDKRGLTPLQFVEILGKHEIANMIRDAMTRTAATPAHAPTPNIPNRNSDPIVNPGIPQPAARPETVKPSAEQPTPQQPLPKEKDVDPAPAKNQILFDPNGHIATYLASKSVKELAVDIDRNLKKNGILYNTSKGNSFLHTNLKKLQNELTREDIEAGILVFPEHIKQKMAEIDAALDTRRKDRRSLFGDIKQTIEDGVVAIVSILSRLSGKKVDNPALKLACNECANLMTQVQDYKRNAGGHEQSHGFSQTQGIHVTRLQESRRSQVEKGRSIT